MITPEAGKTKRTTRSIIVPESGGRRAAGRAREVLVETIQRVRTSRPPSLAIPEPIIVPPRQPTPPVIPMPPPPAVPQQLPVAAPITIPPDALPKVGRGRRPRPVVTTPLEILTPSARRLPSEQLIAVGLRINQRRTALNISRRRLGDLLSKPLTKGAIAHWETGAVGMSITQVHDVARILQVDPVWLAFGPQPGATIPVAGEINRGGIVTDSHNNLDRVPMPPGFGDYQIELAAYRVATDAIAPFRAGDIVYTAKRATRNTTMMVGHDAIVQLQNGQRLLRMVEFSDKPGCVSLADSQGHVIPDVDPMNIWLVLAMIRGAVLEQERKRLDEEQTKQSE